MSTVSRIGRVLLTNDDGFDAPGLAALADVAAQIADDIWIVAPQLDQSGMGQSLTLNNPLRCIQRDEKRFAVSGTPADCVIMALSHLMQDNRPTLILSGVNVGANTGDDANVSGTLGAALTGIMLGLPAIGISLACSSRKHARWDTARASLPKLLADLWHKGWDQNLCLSINLPDLPAAHIKGVSYTRLACNTIPSFTVEKREDLREKDYFWLYPNSAEADNGPETDVGALERGHIAITPLALDRSALKR